MNKTIYVVTVLLAILFVTVTSCDEYETYEQKRDFERSQISSFVNNPTMGEITGKKINVITETEFLKDTVTDLSKNEFVLFEDGVYMQIVRRGCGSILKNGEAATVLCRFKEYNINTGELSVRNDSAYYGHQYYDKFDVTNSSGTLTGVFCIEGGEYQSMLCHQYGNHLVPDGILEPLKYIKLGRPTNAGEEIAKVRLIVPDDQSHTPNDINYMCAYYYEITYERGI